MISDFKALQIVNWSLTLIDKEGSLFASEINALTSNFICFFLLLFRENIVNSFDANVFITSVFS